MSRATDGPPSSRRSRIAVAVALASLVAAPPAARAAPPHRGAPSAASRAAPPSADRVAALAAALRAQGVAPEQLVSRLLDAHDLLIVDDAVHDAHEPWVFYQALLRAPSFHARVKTVFLETLPVTAQPALDRYVASSTPDPSLLERAFQDDYAGTGWAYQDTFDLIETVRQVNQGLPASERVRCVAVSPPIYWEAIHSHDDYERFLDTLATRDYAMYLTIRAQLDGFAAGRKGLFLTNTRHAYKHLRTRDGRTAWNTATFFHHWDPGKAASVRIHNLALQLVPRGGPATAPRSAQGLDGFTTAWVRVDRGAWDAAFAQLPDAPIAIAIASTPFASTPFVGPSAHSAAPDLTFGELYDAVIFLAPVERLHVSARATFYFTPAYRRELARRFAIMYPAPADLRARCGVDTADACITKLSAAVGVAPAARQPAVP